MNLANKDPVFAVCIEVDKKLVNQRLVTFLAEVGLNQVLVLDGIFWLSLERLR